MNQFPAYDVTMSETHHIHKLDAPSGTAITLAEEILENRLTFSVGLTSFHFTRIYGTVFEGMSSYLYFRRESRFYFIEETGFLLLGRRPALGHEYQNECSI